MRLFRFCFAALTVPCFAFAQSIILDNFESLNGWQAVHSHGDACSITITPGTGRTGKAMMMDFAFAGHMGSVSALKRFARTLPSDFQLVFDIRAEAPVNNLIIRIYDTLDNVWIVNRSNFPYPREWTTLRIKKWQLPYGWGPSGRGDLTYMDRIEFIVDVVDGGRGKVWIDNLRIEPTGHGSRGLAPRLHTSSSVPGGTPSFAPDGLTITRWHSAPGPGGQWLEMDFGKPRDVGGLIIQWDPKDFPRAFHIMSSGDHRTWRARYTVGDAAGGRSIIPLGDTEARWLKVVADHPAGRDGITIEKLTCKGPEFSFSPNDLFRAIAVESPRGSFPAYLYDRQSYWTIVGVPEDRSEALINEQGMIEVDRLGFSLEPFLRLDNEFLTWNDVSVKQTLAHNTLPIPTVEWHWGDRAQLHITPLASGPAGSSVLLVRYTLRNTGTTALAGALFVAFRPFQVNPPWQTFTIVGGVSSIHHVLCGDTIAVDNRTIIPLVKPGAAGVCPFDQGDVTEYLRSGHVPPAPGIDDRTGYASGALRWDVNLAPGDSMDVVLAVPFHAERLGLEPSIGAEAACRRFAAAYDASVASWQQQLGNVDIQLPPGAQDIPNSVRTTLAYILINADSVALQPGSRSYERSWIRDGSMMCAALLQMGVREPVRKYLEWYGTYQYPDGKIPCVVDDRGAEPIPEHDSHGQYIYAVMQYFQFTRDTAWLRTRWPGVIKAVHYIQTLRASRKTDVYRNGSAEQRACYGLVPESISHEGYSPKPMHSYWDDFFVLRGLKDAALMAVVLGDTGLAREFAAERDDFRHDLYGSLRLLMRDRGINYLPGCVEQAEFGGLSATVGITPVDELGYIPDTLVHATFNRCYQEFLDRENGTVRWDTYLPYEFRFVGTFVYLDEPARAGEMLSWYMQGRRPLAWNGWGEVVWHDVDAPRCIGDMPHSWAGSDFIRSFRSMLAYERERDTSLVLGAGIMESWLDGPAGMRVRNLPTYFGNISFSLQRMGDIVEGEVYGDARTPGGGIILKSPLARPVKLLKSDRPCSISGNEISITQLPVHFRLEY